VSAPSFYIPADFSEDLGPDAYGAWRIGYNGATSELYAYGVDWRPLLRFQSWKAICTLIAHELNQSTVDFFTELEYALEVEAWVDRGLAEGHIEEWFRSECPSIETIRARTLERHTQAAKRRLTQKRRSEFGQSRNHLALSLIEAGHQYVCAERDCEVVSDLTVDHIVPLSRGGSDDLENLRFLCRPHNSSKGAKMPEGGL